MQRLLRKFKCRLPQKEYYQLYPTGSCAGKFYGTAKIHKLPPDGNISNLPLIPIIPNIGTASYQLAKYLAQLLSPLTRSRYTVNSTKDLTVKIKNEKVLQNCNMVSFDVKSLFTSVPLEYTIDIIIKRIFEDHEITTIYTKSEMKKLLTLCTKNVHFSFNKEIYIQIDGVAMGSPLGPVMANIFMVELETTLVSKLEHPVQKWRRFVNNTLVYVKIGSVEDVLSVLNSFPENVKFVYEEKQNTTLPFLDVLFIRDGEKLNTTVYRKDTHNDLYLHWNSFTPVSWKRGTLKSLISRAYMVCSNKTLLEKELKHLKHVFHKINGYPWWVIDQVSTSF